MVAVWSCNENKPCALACAIPFLPMQHSQSRSIIWMLASSNRVRVKVRVKVKVRVSLRIRVSVTDRLRVTNNII